SREPKRPSHSPTDLKRIFLFVVIAAVIGLALWKFYPRNLTYSPSYRAYAYVTNGKSGTVSVIDVYPRVGAATALRAFRSITVGDNPTGLAANPTRNEVHVVNTDSNNVSVIDAEQNKVVATIGVHRAAYFIAVSQDGRRGYVANSGSANVSVIDLENRKVLANVRVGGGPGLARVSPDGETVVVSNRTDGRVT